MNSTSVALRAKQAAKIAHQKLTEFTLESSLMRDLIHSWLTKLSAGDRGVLAADHTIIARKKFEEHLTAQIGMWNKFAEQDSLKDFVTPRIKFAERCASLIPNEGRKWMLSKLANSPDLTIFLPEIQRYLVSWNFTLKDAINELKRDSQTSIVRKLMAMPDMDAWTKDQTLEVLLEHKGINKYLAYLLQTILESTYLNCTSLYSYHIEQTLVHPTFGMKNEKGACLKAGDLDCDCTNCLAGISYKQTALERIEWHRNIVGDAILQSKVWGGFKDFVAHLHTLDAAKFTAISSRISEANNALLLAAVEFKVMKKNCEVQLKDLQNKVSTAQNALTSSTSVNADLNNKLQAIQQGRNIADTIDSDASKKADIAARENARQIKQMRNELDAKTNELRNTNALLTAFMSPQDERTEPESETITLAEIRLKRGVVIGGHYTLTDKLRKQLPKCTFYSPDAKSVDANVIQNCEYVFFLTEYVNHSLSGRALNLSREYKVKQGYTSKTNVQLVLEDMANMFAKKLS